MKNLAHLFILQGSAHFEKNDGQFAAEAKVTDKTFYQTAVFPFPKNKIGLEIDSRQRDGNFKTIYKSAINPDNYFILKEKHRLNSKLQSSKTNCKTK